MKTTYPATFLILATASLLATAASDGPTRTPRGPAHTIAAPVRRAATAAEATPYTLPMFIEPTQSQFDAFVKLDGNRDGKTWKYMTAGYLKYDYNDDLDADEWVFIPFTTAEQESFLKLTVQSRVQSKDYQESFEIAWGASPEPEAMTVVLDVDGITHTQWQSHNASFGTTGAGTNWLGVHANSVKGQYGLWIKEISLEQQNTPVPLAPVLSTSAIDGLAYTATVAMPSSTIQGKGIDGTVGLSVAVDGTEATNYPDCTPGGNQDVSLTLTKGRHQITFTPYLMVDGERSYGAPAEDNVRASSGGVLTLPVFMTPTQDEFDADLDVFDANHDGNTWIYSSQEQSLQYSYNANPADDWVFLPAIDFGTKGGAFDLTVDAKCESAYSPESFEICVGRTATAAAMTPMLSCPNITNHIWDTYTGTITIPEGGRWYVGIHCISEANQWNLYVRDISISAAPDDTPGIPTVKSIDFTGTEGAITYTLPGATVDNRPLTAPVSLIVAADGTEISRTQPAAGGSDVTVPMTLSLGRHTITASATTGEGPQALSGAPAVTALTVTMPEGYAYPLPFEMRPTRGEFETLATLDASEAGINWDYNAGADNGNGAMICRTVDDKASDAWVFFPKVAITDASRIYTVKASARAYLEQFPEDFEVCIGTDATPEAMTHTLIVKRGYNTYLYQQLTADFIAPAPGTYVLGIHRSSGGSAHTLSVHSVGIADSGRSAGAPAEATDITATADPAGALKASVAFNMPLYDIAGAELDRQTTLTATVSSDAGASATVQGKPGERVSATVGGKDGFTVFTVCVASDAHGPGKGTDIQAYCGFDKPGQPSVSSTCSDDNMSMTITWTDAATGANGGAVDPASLRHNVYKAIDADGEYWSLIEELPAGTTSYTYIHGNTTQEVDFIAVAAVNDKGTSSITPAYEVLGTPYPLPMADDFSTGRYMYTPVLYLSPTDDYSPNWFFNDPGQVIPALAEAGTKAIFCINTPEENYKYARLTLPKFSTADTPAARLTLTAYASEATPKATVYATAYGAGAVPVGEIPAGGSDSYRELTFDLPTPLLGQKWVGLYIEVEFGEGPQAFILRDYEVRSVFDKQLSTVVSCADVMSLGESYTVTGKVTNMSETTQTLPEVKCTLGTTTLTAQSTPAESGIAPGQTVSYTYSVEPTADMMGRHTLRFGLEGYSDQVPADDSAELEVSITRGDRPVVLDLSGSITPEGTFALSWTEPEIKHIGDDDVEGYESFTYAPTIGPWLNVDRDGLNVYGIGTPYPGEFLPKAFQVIDTDALPAGTVIPAYSGSKYFMVVTPEDGPADDWLISPEVAGGSKVSFRLNILSEAQGAESVDVMYSTTGREPGDFTLLKTFSQARIAWNPLEVTLPAETRYFAFHYRCDDLFGICLDDICYSPLSDAEIVGYNVYLNDNKVNGGLTSTGYIHPATADGDRFNVTVLTRIGDTSTEHPKSNTVVAGSTGILGVTALNAAVTGHEGYIRIRGLEGHSAAIYTTDGRLAAASGRLDSDERIDLAPGLYLVEINGHGTVKAAVR